MVILIIIAVVVLLLYFSYKWYKKCKVGSLAMVTGGVKTGKTTLAVYIALREYKKAMLAYKIKKLFGKNPEKPLLYSNIPLKVPYVEVTKDMLLRNERFAYKSVILISEASLFADSQLIKNPTINEQLLLFNKLIGHETRGGKIIYDTQCINDCHYSIKRCLSEYFYIHHINKFIPFFIFAYVKECRYSDDNSVISTETEDIEESLKLVIIPKSTWKKFDAYCYSVLTDELDYSKNCVDPTKLKDLKQGNIPSFREYKCLKKGDRNES